MTGAEQRSQVKKGSVHNIHRGSESGYLAEIKSRCPLRDGAHLDSTINPKWSHY